MANEYSMLYGVDENGYVKTGLQGQVYKNKEDIELLSKKIETAVSGVLMVLKVLLNIVKHQQQIK